MTPTTPQEARRLLLLNTLGGLDSDTLREIHRQYLSEFTPELQWRSDTPDPLATLITLRGGLMSFEIYHGEGMWTQWGTPDQWAYWDYPEIELGWAMSKERLDVLARIPRPPSLENLDALV